jgi:hypothetical protein
MEEGDSIGKLIVIQIISVNFKANLCINKGENHMKKKISKVICTMLVLSFILSTQIAEAVTTYGCTDLYLPADSWVAFLASKETYVQTATANCREVSKVKATHDTTYQKVKVTCMDSSENNYISDEYVLKENSGNHTLALTTYVPIGEQYCIAFKGNDPDLDAYLTADFLFN